MTLGRNFRHGFCRQALATVWLLAAAVLVLTILSANAGARDEVVAGMFRCAAVGETRVWLDCYYGAAQPLRLQLGMVPAPQSQVRLVQNPPAGAPAGDPAPRYQVTASALRCNDLSEDRPWLNCYYAAAGPVRAQLGLSPAPQAHVIAPIPTVGAGASILNSPPQPTTPHAPPRTQSAARNSEWFQVASYNFNRYGMFTITLVNGQKWQQLSGDTDFAHWTKPASNYWVRVTPGALRSLNLKVRGEAAAYKVEQIN
jgi:hypothetical protein